MQPLPPARLVLACLLAAMSCALPAQPEVDARIEAEPELDAADLVMPALLHGPDYRVDPDVPVVGYQARFLIRTPWGQIPAESREMLALRIAEMPAVEALHDASVSETLAQASTEAATALGRSAARIARQPLATVTGLPGGVARYFVRQWRKLDQRATRLGDRIQRSLGEDGNPYSDAEGPLTATRVSDPEPRPWYRKPVRETSRLVRSELGYSRARRELAQKLGVDPATSNPLLRPRLDALTWASAGGRTLGSLALGGLDGGLEDMVGHVGQIDEVVWTLDPDDLLARNEARLSAHCQDARQRRRFFRHRPFTPALQTRMVELLHDLAPAQGCEALLDVALMSGDEVEARFLINALRLTAAYLGDARRGIRLVPIGATLEIHTASGECLLPLPVDHLSWTFQVRDFFDAAPAPCVQGTVLTSGGISRLAQRQLTQRGYSLVQHLPWADAPALGFSPSQPEAALPRDRVHSRD